MDTFRMDFNNCKHVLRGKGLRLQERPWETAIFKVDVYSLSFEEKPVSQNESDWLEALKRVDAECRGKKSLVSARVSSLNSKAIECLEENGYRLMECYLEFKHDLVDIPAESGMNRIGRFMLSEVPFMEELAATSFRYSRFHMDPRIPIADSDKSRAEWVKNACNGRADEVFVARSSDCLVGFSACMLKDCEDLKMGILDLIAVHPDFRSKRIGWDLTCRFLAFCRENGCRMAKVGTQAHNHPSIRLYERIGFLVKRSFYTFHKHFH
ncbi:hypothetical protein DSCOOX_15140 [Desulfosarcina ovata subsp. ovata]|uniref:N-acetyltransferase domain-containing protein n=1 Tax=Desulfosarcina ovata subsp. ovata TaxID=2752305 RepID=A0A5K8A7J4_9BACT|nr:hypothetical protein DSCOOX_15140 [Desulfosarcina ovata subsp. ovata]